jgi:hypothetical protein
VEHPLEALFGTGHSLGGAMALLFALTVSGNTAHRPIAERMRAVYTFGQPMALAMPLPQATAKLERKVFRHVLVQDPIPALPAAPWGPSCTWGRSSGT